MLRRVVKWGSLLLLLVLVLGVLGAAAPLRSPRRAPGLW